MRQDIAGRIAGYHNRWRLHSSIGHRAPIQCEVMRDAVQVAVR
ncbi:hypothetical protein [Paraburkholderia caffeinilytica]